MKKKERRAGTQFGGRELTEAADILDSILGTMCVYITLEIWLGNRNQDEYLHMCLFYEKW